MRKNRCVYVYMRVKKTSSGAIEYPYYVGKGTIRRAYDWLRHKNVNCPKDACNIRILAKDMSDIDAMQAEMLLIYLYGRKTDSKRPGPLQNRSGGGDGPASMDDIAIAIASERDAEFWAHNPGFNLTQHRDGYWYSPAYPTIKSSTGAWLRKRYDVPAMPRKAPSRVILAKMTVHGISRKLAEDRPPNSVIEGELQHYEQFGSFRCPTYYLNECKCLLVAG